MDYHGRIMNIEVDVASMAAAGKPRSLRFAFKAGHRDARHAAAEIALEAQAEIARLETDLELARRDAERLDWFRTLTPHKLARIRAAFMPDSAGDVRATIDAARAGNGG